MVVMKWVWSLYMPVKWAAFGVLWCSCDLFSNEAGKKRGMGWDEMSTESTTDVSCSTGNKKPSADGHFDTGSCNKVETYIEQQWKLVQLMQQRRLRSVPGWQRLRVNPWAIINVSLSNTLPTRYFGGTAIRTLWTTILGCPILINMFTPIIP